MFHYLALKSRVCCVSWWIFLAEVWESSRLYSLYLEIFWELLSWDPRVWSKTLAVFGFHVTQYCFSLAFVRKACTNNALLFPNTAKFSPLLPVFVACLWKDLVFFALELALMWRHSVLATVCSSTQGPEFLFSKHYYPLFMVRLD